MLSGTIGKFKNVSSRNNFMINVQVFETDKDKIVEYCSYAVKFFENVCMNKR